MSSVLLINAVYRSCGLPQYDGNPLIEALPPIRTEQEWIEQLIETPPITDAQRKAESHIRAYHVSRLKHLYVPDTGSLQLARRLDRLVRDGLVSRNPLRPTRAKLLQQAYERGQKGGAIEPVAYGEDVPIASMAVIGASGMGKSTTVHRVLYSYPQYIFHADHHFHQVVWLKVETPKDGSVRDLALNILRAFDQVLGSEHAKPFEANKGTAKEATAKAAALSVTYGLGVLVIDEIQNLSARKSGGRGEMLNWFQELVNTFHLPIVIMGTPKTRVLLISELHNARRVGTSGTLTWQPLANDADFRTLLEELWGMLLLREAGPIADELRNTIHDQTQGIRAFMADFLLVAQLEALRLGHESITPEFFTHIARTEFSQVQPFIAALRSKDHRKLAKFEDVCDYSLDDIIERKKAALAEAAEKGRRASSAPLSLFDQALKNVMCALPIDKAEATALVFKALTDLPAGTASALTKAAIRAYADEFDTKSAA